MLSVERKYLEAAFESILDAHGSLDAYIETVLGISQDERDAIRARLIEKV